MDTTICPWCHTEIVWDEELGPEETCPHCDNELNGYRTVSISRDDLDDGFEDEVPLEGAGNADDLWGDSEGESVVPVFNTLGKYQDTHDLHHYESGVAAVLDEQLEALECPRCQQYLLEAGTSLVTGDSFKPSISSALGASVLKAPFSLIVYVCPSCFHVEHSLAEEGRVQMLRNLSGNKS